MPAATLTLASIAAAALAALMGFAIQRGATCTVAAVEQVLFERRWERFLGILEAALWVLAGLLLAHVLGVPMVLPPGYALSGHTLFGGMLLGLGACINGACVFGAVARLGCGEWSYLATPPGFFVGCLLAHDLGTPGLTAVPYAAPAPALAAVMVWALGCAIVLRVVLALLRRQEAHRHSWVLHLHHTVAVRLWAPGAATVVIGVAFVGLFLLAGAWAYTDVLRELALGTRMGLLPRTLLLLALFLGAVGGGLTARRQRARSIRLPAVLRCFAGGIVMGIGSWLIPGGNDGLLLVGMPLLWPYAWGAFASMVSTIVLVLGLGRWLRRQGAPVAPDATSGSAAKGT